LRQNHAEIFDARLQAWKALRASFARRMIGIPQSTWLARIFIPGEPSK
jgi:hypothetical protein